MKVLATLLPALLAGSLHAFSFAPWPMWWLQIVALTLLLSWWLRTTAVAESSRAWRSDAAMGASFGMGWFVTGLYWLYISMHDFGGMPAILAAAAVLLFSAYLSLFPALVLIVTRKLAGLTLSQSSSRSPSSSGGLANMSTAVIFAGCWTIADWLRGQLFTGFPWLSAGYAHVEGPLAGWAPVIGVFGISGLAALVAFAAALLVGRIGDLRSTPTGTPRWSAARLGATLLGIVLPTLVGHQLSQWSWTQAYGSPIRVRLLQGNVAQQMKFDPQHSLQSMRAYAAMINQAPVAGQGPIDLTVLPETAWTVPWPGTPPEIVRSIFTATNQHGVIALGAPMTPAPLPANDLAGQSTRDASSGPLDYAIANSVLVLARQPAGTVIAQYDKHHLVPFGEFIPWGFRWFVDLMSIPLGTFTRGAREQAPVAIDGQRVAFNICYEDLFGEELLPAVRQGASILINVSNIGWFGDSLALPQHLQIARMRALETRRPMLRSTNTGVTASIDANGQVRAQLPVFATGVLDDQVQGTQGLTPYATFGNTLALIVAALLIAVGLFTRRLTAR